MNGVFERRQLLPLLRELGDLKRITSAARPGSIAERAFRDAWAALVRGEPPDAVALATTRACLVATRLGDLDIPTLLRLGLDGSDAKAVRRDALGDLADLLGPATYARLAEADELPSADKDGGLPFVDELARQPRAGVTCPGKPRIVLQPAENHAEHCLVVAVYAVLLAEDGCDLGTVFLAALAHHLHNAAMPDAGFTGETLLGAHLEPAMRRATEAALAELAPALRDAVAAARAILPDADTAEGRAFHAADVIDRVLEIDQHLAAARLTMDTVLGDMALVHDGPVKPFHDRVLADMGIP